MPDDGSFPGSFVICPVCFWEDDDVQLENPNFAVGAIYRYEGEFEIVDDVPF
jgi:hypothetical protein